MKQHFYSVVIAISIGLFSASALAGNVDIIEENKKFSKKKLSIKVGDSITFINKDDRVHNVYAKGDNAFDIGAQKPGQTDKVVFDKAGKVKVKCAIHPRMKLTVKVQ